MSEIQNYEEYWKFTAALTDYDASDFRDTLKICVDFIDLNSGDEYSTEKYRKLQELLNENLNIDDASIRKRINQLVKMGFINSYLQSYIPEAKLYLDARTRRKRSSLLSKIVYSNSSFNRSVTNESNLHQLNFLINTLVEVGELSQEDIIALMLVDIEAFEGGYIDRNTLNFYVAKVEEIDFIERKYNQISHLINLLKKLDDIVFVGGVLYFTEDALEIFGEQLETKTRRRNPYLHLLYKNQLKEESASQFLVEKCMVEERAFPTLIASHIKPFINSTEEEAYDPNNGILLSQNIDGLFDKGYISFNDDGSIIISSKIDVDLRSYLEQYSLNSSFLKNERIHFLNYHRSFFEEKLR